ncbi:siderophore-interacting protein [Pseudorhodobacter turbinis]|nr:siderophore-interacting protein [Pseudorhodobacter turbinis]
MALHFKMAAAGHQTFATVALPFALTRDKFTEYATAQGLTVEQNADTSLIQFQRGVVQVSGDAAQTRLDISSETAAALQLLRDTLAERMKALHIPVVWKPEADKGRPANLSTATVVGVLHLSPAYARVTIEGPDLARFADGGLHFRLLFGPKDAGWPYTDETGVTQWPGGDKAWHRPVYTVRSIVCSAGGSACIDFDIFLHDGGRVTEWTKSVTLGDEVALTGPNGGRADRKAGWQLLIGDETAVPVIARQLAVLPEKTAGKAVLFVPDAADIQSLAHPAGMTVQWALRKDSQTPLDALHAAALPEKDRFVFFAAERSEAVAARGYLGEQGLAKDEFQSAAYWTAPTSDAQ